MNGRRSVFIIGAGQLGSRHLQALKAVSEKLDITVVDPSDVSLKTAKERYEGIPGNMDHAVRYASDIPGSFGTADIAIVPSNSNVRRHIVETLLRNGTVRYLVLEKLLFDRKEDYTAVLELLDAKGVAAWVNCSMRTMPFYASLRSRFTGEPFLYSVNGSQFGLITNAIHYIDHMAYLSGSNIYSVDTQGLEFPPIESKRKGFLELNGTLTARFSNGCVGVFTCFSQGSLPVTVEITSPSTRLLSKESEGKALFSNRDENWRWREIDAPIPFQSQMTARVVSDLIEKGECDLVRYAESMQTHLTLLEGVRRFFDEHGSKHSVPYPFT